MNAVAKIVLNHAIELRARKDPTAPKAIADMAKMVFEWAREALHAGKEAEADDFWSVVKALTEISREEGWSVDGA